MSVIAYIIISQINRFGYCVKTLDLWIACGLRLMPINLRDIAEQLLFLVSCRISSTTGVVHIWCISIDQLSIFMADIEAQFKLSKQTNKQTKTIPIERPDINIRQIPRGVLPLLVCKSHSVQLCLCLFLSLTQKLAVKRKSSREVQFTNTARAKVS